MTTKTEDLIEEEIFAAGAEWKEEEDADLRDFIAGNVVGYPNQKELDEAPEVMDLTVAIKQTINQGCIPKCTAVALCHNVMIQNAIEEKDVDIVVDDVNQWTVNQNKKNSCSDESGDLLENALKGLQKNGVLGGVNNQDIRFKIEGYAFEKRNQYDFDNLIKLIAVRLKQSKPLYCGFKGNGQITKEINAGRWLTVITQGQTTYGHAVILSGIDRKAKDLIFTNSRRFNNNNAKGEKLQSEFRISFDVFKQLLANGIFGRRYWITYDANNMLADPLFVDYAQGEEEEHTEAVKRVKDNGIMKGIEGSNGVRFEPNSPVTRLQLALVLFRFGLWIVKKLGK